MIFYKWKLSALQSNIENNANYFFGIISKLIYPNSAHSWHESE